MKILKTVPEALMVATFLKAELKSTRFSRDVRNAVLSVGASEAVITHPDLNDRQENDLRAQVLGDYRGYRQNREMFTGFPDNLSWYEAELSRNEIGELRYVDYSYWNELTDNSHLVKDGVKNIQKGKIVFNVPNDRFLDFADKLLHGVHDLEPMILWGQDVDSPLEILEGHLRATALGLAGGKTPSSIKVIVGLASPPIGIHAQDHIG